MQTLIYTPIIKALLDEIAMTRCIRVVDISHQERIELINHYNKGV